MSAPRGAVLLRDKMIDFYTWTTPNGRKVSILLEEAGLAYTPHAVNLLNDEQFKPDFLAISPNNKIPAIIDRDTGGEPVSLFESGAILLYLAEKSGKFLPDDAQARARVLEWLFWQMSAIGPILGQAGHFINTAPEKVPYAIDRFLGESVRLLKVLDKQLATSEFVAGEYSIADMALFPWISYALAPLQAARGEALGDLDHIRKWVDIVGQRPAVQKGMAVPEVAS